MTTEELIQYYVNLLIMQYRNKDRAQGTVAAYVAEVVANQIVQQVSDAFALDTAIGDQLTEIGTYRNAPRTIFGLDLGRLFWGMPLYSNISPGSGKGWSTYDVPNPGWYWVLYADVNNLIFTLSDSDLRTLIQYLAETNSSDFGLGNIDDILFRYFGDFLTLTDNGDMTITYTHDSADPNDLFAIVNALGDLPHPSGVEVIVVT